MDAHHMGANPKGNFPSTVPKMRPLVPKAKRTLGMVCSYNPEYDMVSDPMDPELTQAGKMPLLLGSARHSLVRVLLSTWS